MLRVPGLGRFVPTTDLWIPCEKAYQLTYWYSPKHPARQRTHAQPRDVRGGLHVHLFPSSDRVASGADISAMDVMSKQTTRRVAPFERTPPISEAPSVCKTNILMQGDTSNAIGSINSLRKYTPGLAPLCASQIVKDGTVALTQERDGNGRRCELHYGVAVRVWQGSTVSSATCCVTFWSLVCFFLSHVHFVCPIRPLFSYPNHACFSPRCHLFGP